MHIVWYLLGIALLLEGFLAFDLNGTVVTEELDVGLALSITSASLCFISWRDSFGLLLNISDTLNVPVFPLEHTYSRAGDTVTMSYCFTQDEFGLFQSPDFYVGLRVEGVEAADGLKPPVVQAPNAQKIGYDLSVNVQKGTSLEIVSTFEFTGETVTIHTSSDKAKLHLNSSHFPTAGIYPLTVNVSNPLNSEQTVVFLNVLEEIEDLQFVSGEEQPIFVEYKVTSLELNFGFKGGSDVLLICNYIDRDGNSDVVKRGIFCPGAVNSVTVPKSTFFTLGDVTLRSTASNAISDETVDIHFFSEFQINSLKINIRDQFSFHSVDVIFEVEVLDVASVPMGTVNVTFEFGDLNLPSGINSTTSKDSPKSENATSEERRNSELNKCGGANPNSALITFNLEGYSLDGMQLVAQTKHCYARADNYSARIYFQNEIGSYSETHLVVIENPVQNVLNIFNDETVIPRSTNATTVGIHITLKEGALPLDYIVCTFNFNDGTEEDVIYGNLTNTNITVSHALQNADSIYAVSEYPVLINCSNHVDYNFFKLFYEVFTDCFASFELFTPRRTRQAPLKWLATEILDVKASVLLTGICRNEVPIFKWSVVIVPGEGLLAKPLPGPNSVAISIPAETFYPGIYRLEFFGSYPAIPGRGSSVYDSIFIQISLPDVFAFIAGNLQFTETVSKGVHTFDASESEDSVKTLDVCHPLVTSVDHACDPDLYTSWTCKQVPAALTTEQDVFNAIITFPEETLIKNLQNCENVNLTSEKILQVDLSALQIDYWYIFIFNVTHSLRWSSTAVAVKVIADVPLQVKMRCLGENCPPKNTKKITAQGLQLDAILEEDLTDDELVYDWTFFKSTDGQVFVDITSAVGSLSETGLDKKGVSVNGDSLETGTKYLIIVNVTLSPLYGGPNRAPGVAKVFWTTNFKPYGGNCTVDRTAGVATVDLFIVLCSDWKDEGSRTERNEAKDVGPNLQYIVFQETPGDIVPRETIFKSFSAKIVVAMKVGAPEMDFKTHLIARVSDQMDFVETNFILTVLPEVNGQANVTEIERFMTKSTDELDERKEFHDNSLTLLITSSVTSQLNTILTPEEKEIIPADVKDTPGGLIDMPNGSADPLSFDEMLSELQPKQLDPVIATTQTAVQNLSMTVDTVLKNVGQEGRISSEITQQLSATMTGMMGKKHGNANNQTKKVITSGLLQLAETVQNSSTSGKTSSLAALQDLGSHLIKAVIPPNLKNRQPIRDQKFLRTVMAGLQETSGTNVSAALDEATITEEEREFHFKRLQEIINFEVEQEKEHGRAASKGLLAVATANQNQTRLCTGCTVALDTENFKQKLETDSGLKLAEKEIAAPSNSSKVQIKGLASSRESLSVAVSTFSDNIFFFDEDEKSSFVTSAVGHVDVMAPDGTKMSQSEFTFTQPVPTPIPVTVTPLIYEEDASKMSAHKIFIRSGDDNLCMLTRPLDARISKYIVYIKTSARPSIIDYDAKEVASEESGWNVCFHPVQLHGHIGTAYVGIVSEAGTAATGRKKRSTESLNTTDADEVTDPMYSPYNFTAVTVGCMVWESDCECWKSDKCDLEWLPWENQIRCNCKDITEMTFGNSFYVPPNTIDFSTVFLKFSPLNQAAVLSVICLVLILYVLLLIWARRQDRRDILKWGTTSLSDNFPDDNYHYTLRVHTGLRPSAGTKSRISFVISGEDEDTGVRELYDGVRQHFSTGSVMNFLMSTPRPLGQLLYLRVWHDNSGGGDYASWYLSKVDVQDIQCRQNFSFICEKWLAIDKDDYLLDCVLPVAEEEDLSTFRRRMFSRTKQNLAESHMWVSVVYRPVTSCFTRVQRVSCAVVFLMLSMVVNAMFYNPGENYEHPTALTVGPFMFSLQQVYISFMSALITTPVPVLIILLFKNYRREYKPEEDNPRKRETKTKKGKGNKYKINFLNPWSQTRQKDSIELENHLVATGLPRYQKFRLAFWWKYVAWSLVVLGVIVPAFFVLLFSMEWGKQKSEEWLTSYLLTWLESLLCLDLLKVVLMAFVLAVICRSMKNEDTVLDRSLILRNSGGEYRASKNCIRVPAPPLSADKLEQAKKDRAMQQKMKTTFWAIAINMFFFWIVASIAYSNRHALSYYLYKEVKNTILEPQQEGRHMFSKISSTTSFFNWLNETMFDELYPDYELDGSHLPWRLRQFTKGKTNFRLGPPRLRQVRSRKERCIKTRLSSAYCYRTYDSSEEETRSYCLGWRDTPCPPEESAYKYSSDAWTFKSALDTLTPPITGHYVTYSGGGYVANLAVNKDLSRKVLQELFDELWIDRQTRAVFVEFTLYSINVNIFIYNIFLVEFPETGGVVTFFWMKPLRLYQHVGAIGLYTLLCEVIFLLFVLSNTVYTIVRIVRQRTKFFKSGWQVLDFISLIISYTAVVLYFFRLFLTNQTISKFNDDRKQFVDFMHIATADNALIALIGCLSFFITLRFLNLLGVSRRLNSIVRIFSIAAKDLFWFGLAFSVMYVVYACFGVLLFGSSLESYKNLYKTLGTLFISMIGKSRFTEIDSTDPVMAKIYFMAFILFMVYLMLTLFLSLLTASIDKVHQEQKDADCSEELLEYVWNKVKNFLRGSQSPSPEDNLHTPCCKPERRFDGKFSSLDSKDILLDLRDTFSTLDTLDAKHNMTTLSKPKRVRFN